MSCNAEIHNNIVTPLLSTTRVYDQYNSLIPYTVFNNNCISLIYIQVQSEFWSCTGCSKKVPGQVKYFISVSDLCKSVATCILLFYFLIQFYYSFIWTIVGKEGINTMALKVQSISESLIFCSTTYSTLQFTLGTIWQCNSAWGQQNNFKKLVTWCRKPVSLLHLALTSFHGTEQKSLSFVWKQEWQ